MISKLILTTGSNHAILVRPALHTMKAMTNGGLGELPGDTVTADLAENEARRIEVSRSMPQDRAITNMVQDGYDEGFAQKWCRALIGGGETDASALGLIRQQASGTRGMPETDCAAVGYEDLPSDRSYRDAWRKRGNGIEVDLGLAKAIFAARVIKAKSRDVLEHKTAAEQSMLLGNASDVLEKTYITLLNLDLRALGAKVMKAESIDQLAALWPAELKHSAVI